jgi:hypothetical protein
MRGRAAAADVGQVRGGDAAQQDAGRVPAADRGEGVGARRAHGDVSSDRRQPGDDGALRPPLPAAWRQPVVCAAGGCRQFIIIRTEVVTEIALGTFFLFIESSASLTGWGAAVWAGQAQLKTTSGQSLQFSQLRSVLGSLS